MIHQIIIGLIGGIIIAVFSIDVGWLRNGRAAMAAALVGGLTFGFAGIAGAFLLLAFFGSANLITKLPRIKSRPRVATDTAPRGRTAGQVMANGGVIAVAAIFVGLAEGFGIGGVTWARVALAGAIASVTADTWATEIGMWWGATPRSAVTARPLSPGESGGVTPAGLFAGMMGAAWIGVIAYFLWPDVGPREAVFIEVAGFFGMWLDSALGATLQYKADCPECDGIVEDPRHAHEVKNARGLRFLTNNGVNVVAALAGALVALYLIVSA